MVTNKFVYDSGAFLLNCLPSFLLSQPLKRKARREEKKKKSRKFWTIVLLLKTKQAALSPSIHPSRTIRGAGECPIPFPIEKDALPQKHLPNAHKSLYLAGKVSFIPTVGGHRKLQYLFNAYQCNRRLMNVKLVKGLINKNKQTAAHASKVGVFIPLSVNIIQKKNNPNSLFFSPFYRCVQ